MGNVEDWRWVTDRGSVVELDPRGRPLRVVGGPTDRHADVEADHVGAVAAVLARDLDHSFAALLGLSHIARWGHAAIADDDADELDRHALRGSLLCRRLSAICEHATRPLGPVDIVATAEAAAGSIGSIAPPSVTIECRLDPETPPVLADESLLSEMVSLMLDQAVDGLHRGGGVALLRVDVEDDAVAIGVYSQRTDPPGAEKTGSAGFDDLRLRAIASLALAQSTELRLTHEPAAPQVVAVLRRAPA